MLGVGVGVGVETTTPKIAGVGVGVDVRTDSTHSGVGAREALLERLRDLQRTITQVAGNRLIFPSSKPGSSGAVILWKHRSEVDISCI